MPRGAVQRILPGLGEYAPGVLVRALTVPGCPRMLQVALRACAPQTEQVALSSLYVPRVPCCTKVPVGCM
ncbi:hypothetical protein D7M15_04780 [Streptomyces sp. Z26]|nr:hypothetical protein D7M15_04780 [Streptomyces sp. Z26]